MNAKKIFITGNNSLICQALRNMINSCENLICIGEAQSGSSLLDKIISPPDLVLLDLEMPYLKTPLDIINQLEKSYPSLKIATLTDNLNKSLLIHRSQFSTDGYILKSDPCTQIKEAIIAVAQGEKYCSNQIMRLMLEATLSQTPQLTKRETEVFFLVSKSNQEIAEQLNISASTVKTHITRIKFKLSVKTREELRELAA